MTERITLAVEGPVATVTLQRPDQLNPIDKLTLAGLIGALDTFNEDNDLSVMIVTATGRAFSAGGDIKEMETDTAESFGDTTALYQELARKVTGSPKILIAAINGYALGGGTRTRPRLRPPHRRRVSQARTA